MNDPLLRFDELIAAMKERNYRMTPQRIELVRLIAASEGHPSALQLYEKVKLQFPTMSQATVYKTLALLKEMDQLVEIDLTYDNHYDGNRPEPHPHLVCLKCNKIVDCDLIIDNSTIGDLEKSSGYQIVRPHLLFYGYCPECRKNK